MNRPSAVLTLDGRSFTAAEAALVHLRLELARGCHDAAELVLWPGSRCAGAAPGAQLTLALGEAGSEEDVLAGEVTAAAARTDHVAIEALSPTAVLARSYRSQSYVRQTVADIVRDLAGSVTVDEIESDLELAAYGVDDRRPVWSHLRDLAVLAGADLGSSASGGLRFVPVRSGTAAHTFRHGAELLAWTLRQNPARVAPVVAAHGAGSEAGSERWHWLRNDPVGASSTSVTRVIGALATRESADAASKSLSGAAERAAVRGEVTVLGAPAVRPGDLVDLDALPSGSPGTLRVLRVVHSLDGARGYVTTLSVESAGGGGLGL